MLFLVLPYFKSKLDFGKELVTERRTERAIILTKELIDVDIISKKVADDKKSRCSEAAHTHFANVCLVEKDERVDRLKFGHFY